MQHEKYAEALGLYAGLLKKYPQAGPWGEYGRAAAVAGELDLAGQVWQSIRCRQPDNADLLCEIAREYQSVRLHAKARELYQQAAALAPRTLDIQLRLAWLLARTNSAAEARVVVNRCLALEGGNEQARYLSAHLDRRENKLADAEGQFRALLASAPRGPYVAYACHAELAHILDRTERFAEAMAQLALGKQVARPTQAEEAERRNIEAWHQDLLVTTRVLPVNIIDKWARAFPPRARHAVPSLAFLSGPARSGTTLLEKILDAHPMVAACDEPLAFSFVQPLIDPAAPAIPAQRLEVLRQRYVKNICQALGSAPAGRLLLDKNPSHTAWLPAFLRAFPELRVVIALRDPRDVLVSLYFQNNAKTNGLTFPQLAQYYADVMNLWLAVRAWDGLAWLETRYEDTVGDLRAEGSRVTAFLGLEWHENQARFYEGNREKTVMSNNYSDVSQPVYTRSVGRWRHYAKHLDPVLPVLEPFCKTFGYT